MAYYGKVFKSDKDDNLEGFFRALGTIPEEHIPTMLKTPATEKITKDGDTYTLETTGIRKLTFKFKSGDTVVDKINEQVTATSVFTVDGNVVTQKQTGIGGKEVTFKREFTDNLLTEIITVAGWDGVAYRYFKP